MIAKKFDPLITLDELTYEAILFIMLFLNSSAVVSLSNGLLMHLLLLIT